MQRLLVVFLIFAGAFPALAAERNVILFVVDDQGLDAGCYGNPAIQTPSLDRLANTGTLFTHAFCTTASCSASRSVLLTGMYNHANAQYGHAHTYHHFKTFENIRSLPARLADAGYRTVQIGKYHVAPESVYPFETRLPGSARNAVEMAEACQDVIHEESDQPFFLYFCTSDPHRGGGKVESSPLKPDRFGNRPQGYPGVEEVTYSPEDVLVPPFLPDTPECRAELAQYYQSVSRLDQGLGALLDTLEAAGHADDTLIIYLSDNGIAFPGAKTTLYEPGMRLPCVARNPYQSSRGLVTDAMITWADVAPTILEFAGAEHEGSGLHGRSFLDTLDQPQTSGWDEVYASHTFHEITMYYPMRVVRGRRYKLTWNIAHPLPFPFASDLWEAATWQSVLSREGAKYGQRSVENYIHRAEFELYDLEKDPHEIHNLAAHPEHQARLRELQAKLREFQKRTSDPWILKWEYE